MNMDEQIILVGEKLKGRLEPSLIDFALDYINHAESVLAFETLCDHIADYEIKISKDEYKNIIFIATELGLEIDNRFIFIDPDKK